MTQKHLCPHRWAMTLNFISQQLWGLKGTMSFLSSSNGNYDLTDGRS